METENHDQSVPKNFPERLRRLRKAKGYTQEELGRLADVHNVNLSRYERGLSNPSSVVLKKLAEALGVSVGHLVEGDPNEVPASRLQDPELRQHIEEIERLPEKEQRVVKEFLEAFLFRHRVRGLAH